MRESMPSPDDIAKAEAFMSPEQQQATEIRERFKFQERDAFEDFLAHIDQDGERRAATESEREQMDENISKLGTLFEGSDLRWQIDGALNISLARGEYIGIHKDVDVSIERDELEKIDAQLERKGYGLFLSYAADSADPESKKIMERVGARQFSQADEDHLLIAAIDEQGKIRENETLNFIDVHLAKRDAQGSPLGARDVVLPEKWYEPQPIAFKGQKVNLSHPAKTAYFKLHQTRSYDRTDLQLLAKSGQLSQEDVSEIERVMTQETEKRKSEAELFFKKVAGKITSESTAQQIFDTLAAEPEITKGIDQFRAPLKLLSEKIVDSDRSAETIKALAFEIFNIEDSFAESKKKMDEFRRWVNEATEEKKIREEL